MPHDAPQLSLVSVNGPKRISLELVPGDQPRSIGRLTTHAISLDHPSVSREHAELRFETDSQGGQWLIEDCGSKHGTRVNSVLLTPGRACPIQVGDHIEIMPWTLQVMGRAPAPGSERRLVTVDDSATHGSTVALVKPDAVGRLDRERLQLILDCAESIQGAPDQQSLARTVLSAAVRGAGFANAAFLAPLAADGTVSVIDQIGSISGNENGPRLSRTLIQEASRGKAVQLMGQANPLHEAVSVISLGIHEAICVPLMVESVVAGYLYMDNRLPGRSPMAIAPDAGAFVAGLGRLASLALANLMRLDLEKRYSRMEGELAAAAAAQRMILPPRQGGFGPLSYIGECRPGRTISGDFFDVFALPDGRTVILLGDVAGKGIAASVHMTTTQGFLYAALGQHGDAARAANDLNALFHQRDESGKFITLWIGVLDHSAATLTYLNAGHGYAWLAGPSSGLRLLDEAGGPPIGVMPQPDYQAQVIPLESHGCLAVVSDGIIEQQGRSSDGSSGDEFSRSRVEKHVCSMSAGQDNVASLFAAVHAHAGSPELADDATVVIAQW